MSSAQSLLTQLRGNRRLRMGVVLIVAILWLYGLLVLGDVVKQQQAELNTEARLLGHAERLMDEGDWAERALQAAAVRTDLEQRLGRRPTAGLARAEFEEALRRAAKAAAVGNFNLQIGNASESAADVESARANPAAGVPNLVVFNAKLSFEFRPVDAWRFLEVLTTGGALVRVDGLRIRLDPARVELDVTGFYQLAEDPE